MLRIKKFWTTYPVGRDPVDWVELYHAGDDKMTAIHRVKKLMPPEDPGGRVENSLSFKSMVARWGIIGPAYEAYRKNETLPEDGTPLAAWGGVSKEQIDVLKGMDIRTVEDVAAMGEAMIARLRFPDARKLPDTAKKYLEGKDSAEKDAEIAAMKEQMAAMQELLEEQAKPKRGRPRKEVEAA